MTNHHRFQSQVANDHCDEAANGNTSAAAWRTLARLPRGPTYTHLVQAAPQISLSQVCLDASVSESRRHISPWVRFSFPFVAPPSLCSPDQGRLMRTSGVGKVTTAPTAELLASMHAALRACRCDGCVHALTRGDAKVVTHSGQSVWVQVTGHLSQPAR